jgi:hypothetical protein
MVKFNVTIPRGNSFLILFFLIIDSPLLLTFVLDDDDDDGLYIVATAQSTYTGVTHAFNIILK